MTRMRYGANFFAAWASRGKSLTRVTAPTVGDTWVFADLAKKERKDGSVTHMPTPKVGQTWIFTSSEEDEEKKPVEGAEGFPSKVMGVLTAYGVLMAAAENVGKLAGAAHAAYKLGYTDAGKRIAQKLSLINTEKEETKSKIGLTSTTTKEILLKVSNIEKLLLEREMGKQGVGAGAGAGGGKEKKDSDGDSHSDNGKSGGSNSGGGKGGGNGGANGGGRGGANGGANGGNDATASGGNGVAGGTDNGGIGVNVFDLF